MPSLSEILNDPNYLNANEETKAAIFTKYAPTDENYTQANAATQAAIRQRFGVEGQPGIGPQGGFDTALYSGYQGLKGGLAGLAGRLGIMDVEKAKQIQEETEEKGKKAFKPTEGGWATDFTGKFAETLGQSLPSMIAPIAAAGIATVAGAPAAVATGLSGLASAIQFAGSNLQRQQERGIELEDTNIGGAIATAIPQAALETLSFRMIPGVQKLFGKAGKEITEAQAAEIAKQGILRSTAAYGAQGARTGGIEGATEVGQQFLERLQAGLTLGDQNAIDEFVGSFVGGAVLGGALSVPGTAMRRTAAREKAAQTPQTTEKPDFGPPDLTSPVVGTTRTTTDGKESVRIRREDGSVEVDGVLVEPPRRSAPEQIAVPESESQRTDIMMAELEGRPLPTEEVVAEPAPSATKVAEPESQVQPPQTSEQLPITEGAPTTSEQRTAPTEADIVRLDDKGEPVDVAAPESREKLDPNVEAQLAAEPLDPDSIILPPEEAPPVRAPKAEKVKASEKILSAHEFIASLGGLNKKEAPEINKDDAQSNLRIGNKWLYASKGGLTAGEAAAKLKQAGYIADEDNNSVYNVISESLSNPVYSIYDADAVAERSFAEQEEERARRDEQRRREGAIEAQDISAEIAAEQQAEAADLGNFRQQMLDAGYTEQDLNVIGFTKASPKLQAEVAALQESVLAAGLEPAFILETLEGELANRNITRQEYYAKAKARLEQAIQEKALQGSGRDVSQTDVQEGAAREEVLALPSEQEVLEQPTSVQISSEQQKIDALNKFEAALSQAAPPFRAISASRTVVLRPQALSKKQVALIKDLAGEAIDLGMPASIFENVSAAGATRMGALAAISQESGWLLLGGQWNSSTRAEKLQALVHELGHSVDNKSAKSGKKVSEENQWQKAHDELKNWYNLSETKSTHPLNYPFNNQFIGKLNPKSESFAQAFSFYFVSPVDLQTNAPEAYSQIQSIVEGIQNESQRTGATGATKAGAAGVEVQPSRTQKGTEVQSKAGEVSAGISQAERVKDRGSQVSFRKLTDAEREEIASDPYGKMALQKYDESFDAYNKLPSSVQKKIDSAKIASRKATTTAQDPGSWDRGARAAATKTFKAANQAIENYLGRELTASELELYLSDAQARVEEYLEGPNIEDVDFVKSPEFNKWFDDSKVVDEDGNPLVMYHSTYSSFPKFTTNFGENEYFQFGIHIGTQEAAENRLDLKRSEDQARGVRAPDSGANIIPLYASIKNPLRLDENRSGRWGVDDIMNAVMQKADETGIEGISNENLDDFYNDRFDIEEWAGLRAEPGSPDYDPESIDRSWSDVNEFTAGERSSLLKVFLKQLGYDGIVYKNEFEGGGDSYIALDSNQVKSVFNLRPTKSENISFAQKPAQTSLPSVSKPPLKAATTQWNDPEITWKDSFFRKWTDRHVDLKTAQKEIEKVSGKIRDDLNAYQMQDQAHGRIQSQIADFLDYEFSPILKEMTENKITDQELTTYLWMRHAPEANRVIAERNKNNPAKQDGGSGVDTDVAERYIAKLPDARREALESIAKKVDKILAITRDQLQANGIISKEEREAWEAMFKKYVPLKREESDFALPTSTYRGVGKFSKSRTGSTEKSVVDILANVAINREIAIMRIEKERVRRALAGLVLTNPQPGFWKYVSPDAIKNKDQLIQELQDMNIDPSVVDNVFAEPKREYFNRTTGQVESRVDQNQRYADYVVPVKVDGKDRFIFLNPKNERAMSMALALKNMDVQQLNDVLSVVAPVTRWFAAVNTQYNLIFGIWNFARDLGGAAFNLTTTPLANKKAEVIKGVMSTLPDLFKESRVRSKGGAPTSFADGSVQDFVSHGGKIGGRDRFADYTNKANIVEKELKRLNEGNVRKAARATLDWISSANDTLENAIRLSAYRVALKEGMSKQQAADIAKNITVNFNTKGTNANTFGALYAFFNASIRGTARLAETLDPRTSRGRKIMGSLVALGAVQAVILAAAGFDDDEPSEFIKQKNLIIPLGNKNYFMFPMPFGFSLFVNVGRLMFEGAEQAMKGKSVKGKVADLLDATVSAFNPLGGGDLVSTIAPTAADPIVDVLARNKDVFGRPIARLDRATSPSPGFTRSRDPSASISQFLAETINTITGGTAYTKGLVSPTADQIIYLAEQIGGGVYREASRLLQYGAANIKGDEVPEYRVPIKGKLIGSTDSPAAVSQKFYSNVVKMAEHEAEIKGRIKDRASSYQYMKDNPEASLWRRANTLENELTKINKRRRELVSQDAPKERIKQLDDQKTRMMKQFNDAVRQREGR